MTEKAISKNTAPEKLPELGQIGKAMLLIFVGALGAFIIWGIWRAAFPPKPPLQGQMEARTISVSSKVPGRVQEILAREGDFVTRGQPVAKMHLPEIEAKLAQVKAKEKAAKSRESLVYEGARPQEKEGARAEWERANAEAILADKTWRRINALYKDGLVSRQRYDEALAKMRASASQATALKQIYDIAMIGARRQQKAEAKDMSREAAAGVAEVSSMADNCVLVAPQSGQVDKVVLVEGEMAGAGYPVLTLVNLEDQWATFNIREEFMPGIEIGGELTGQVPAIGGREIVFRIYYISPRANYATWRSTRENSGYDMKTFEVRARPSMQVKGLRPGMSVLVDR